MASLSPSSTAEQCYGSSDAVSHRTLFSPTLVKLQGRLQPVYLPNRLRRKGGCAWLTITCDDVAAPRPYVGHNGVSRRRGTYAAIRNAWAQSSTARLRLRAMGQGRGQEGGKDERRDGLHLAISAVRSMHRKRRTRTSSKGSGVRPILYFGFT